MEWLLSHISTLSEFSKNKSLKISNTNKSLDQEGIWFRYVDDALYIFNNKKVNSK